MRPARTLSSSAVALALTVLGAATAIGCRTEPRDGTGTDLAEPPVAGAPVEEPNGAQLGSGAQPGTDAAALPPSAFGGGPMTGVGTNDEGSLDLHEGAEPTGADLAPRGDSAVGSGPPSSTAAGPSHPTGALEGTPPGWVPKAGVHKKTSGPPLGPLRPQLRGPAAVPDH